MWLSFITACKTHCFICMLGIVVMRSDDLRIIYLKRNYRELITVVTESRLWIQTNRNEIFTSQELQNMFKDMENAMV